MPLEASWREELRPLFTMSNFIICKQPPYIHLLKYCAKSFIVRSVVTSRFQNIFRMSSESRSLLFLCNRHILIFKNIMKSSLPLEASPWAEFKTPFRMVNFIIFMLLPYIRFLKYFEKSFTVGRFMMSRIQTTSRNVEVYYFCACAIY